jgi:hypothetical protein
MSVDLLLVFTLVAPPSGASLQAVLDREPNPVQITEAASFSLTRHSGFLPVKYQSYSTGFSVYQSSSEELLGSFPRARSFQKPISAVVSFQIGGNPLECVAAARVASALVRDFQVYVFDPQGGDFMTPESLKTIVLACESEARAKVPR